MRISLLYKKGKTNSGESWCDINREDLLEWLGIYMYMGLKELPQVKSYWEKRVFFGCSLVKLVMSQDRFE